MIKENNQHNYNIMETIRSPSSTSVASSANDVAPLSANGDLDRRVEKVARSSLASVGHWFHNRFIGTYRAVNSLVCLYILNPIALITYGIGKSILTLSTKPFKNRCRHIASSGLIFLLSIKHFIKTPLSTENKSFSTRWGLNLITNDLYGREYIIDNLVSHLLHGKNSDRIKRTIAATQKEEAIDDQANLNDLLPPSPSRASTPTSFSSYDSAADRIDGGLSREYDSGDESDFEDI